jgi:predicted phosphodiesterase
MTTRILLLADIHGNYPALTAIDRALDATAFDFVINCGDSLVYAPFANETLGWLARHRAISILGNTDKKVILLLKGTPFKKPSKPDKRIMYTSTAEVLDEAGKKMLLALAESAQLRLPPTAGDSSKNRLRLGIYHGSPADPDEFLFAETPDARFHELARDSACDIIVTGHSHSPYHKFLSGTHFINPGSAGRMFDGDPRASCAILEIAAAAITVRHLRIAYEIAEVVSAIRTRRLPEIYATMFLQGRKLN